MKNKRIIFILILILAIGFASISTTLVLNGTIGISTKKDDYNVIFTEASLDGNTTNVTISEDKKNITFTAKTLYTVGDSTTLNYKVKNTSTQYDANVTINCTTNADENVEITSLFDGKDIPLAEPVNMLAQEVKIGYISAELIKPYAGEEKEIKISCSLVANAGSREEISYTLNFDSDGGTSIEDKIVNFNGAYGELPVPEKHGHIFLGWYDEDDKEVNENTILENAENKTIHAKWEEKIYPVGIVVKENGTSESEILNVAYNKTSGIKITPENNYYISNIECDNGYTVDDYNPKVPQYGEQVIKIKNNNSDSSGTCTFNFTQGIYNYGYTGNEQEFVVPHDGKYKIELWGASGTDYNSNSNIGGKGSYVSGIINLETNQKLYLYVGESLNTNASVNKPYGSYLFNGATGGNYTCYVYHSGTYAFNYFAGSSTDIRLTNGNWNNFDSLKSRIMVAAGGASANQYQNGAAGGGLNGYSGGHGTGATQTAPGGANKGGFGYGGIPTYSGNICLGNEASGASSGYYGGGAYSYNIENNGMQSAGSGSSFISGHNGCDAIDETSTSSKIIHTGQPNHYSKYVFTDTKMIDGAGYEWTNVKGTDVVGMPTHDGASTMVGNTGSGYAKITLLSLSY